MLRPLLAIAAPLLLLLSGCNRPPAEPQVTLEEVRVTLPAISGRPGALYFTATTNNDPTRLVSITSPRAGRIELHGMTSASGVMQMAPLLEEDTVFTDNRLVFEPGGKHAMLFDIDPALRPGDRIPLTFQFDPAPPVTVEAEVRAPGDAGHGSH